MHIEIDLVANVREAPTEPRLRPVFCITSQAKHLDVGAGQPLHTEPHDPPLDRRAFVRAEHRRGCPAATLAIYLRYLKRVSAHLKNVATSVVNPYHRIGFREKEK